MVDWTTRDDTDSTYPYVYQSLLRMRTYQSARNGHPNSPELVNLCHDIGAR